MIKCLILGGGGMLGHMLVRYLKTLPEFEVYFTTRDRKNEDSIYLDVYKNPELIEGIIKDIKPNFVVNCIGIINKFVTDTNKAEVVFINSYLPHKLAEICHLNRSKLIHISTDCVFDGTEGLYTEESKVSPTDFYGATKAYGEVDDGYNLTIRTSIIGPEICRKVPNGGLMEWFFKQEGNNIKGYINVIWSGLTTLELAKQIVEMYEQNVTGLINIVSEPINKFRLLCLIKEIYKFNVLIESDNQIKCDRSMISKRDTSYKVPTHEDMLKELKRFYKNVN